MPITGFVIVLDGRAGAAHAALETVRADGRFTIGRTSDDGESDRVAAVLETASDAESRERLEWIEAMPGVALVQIAYVDRSDVSNGPERADPKTGPEGQEGSPHDG